MGRLHLLNDREELIKDIEEIDNKVNELHLIFNSFREKYPVDAGEFWALDNSNKLKLFSESDSKLEDELILEKIKCMKIRLYDESLEDK